MNLDDRPPHKGYPGVVCPGKVALIEWLKQEILATHWEAYEKPFDEVFGIPIERKQRSALRYTQKF